MMTMKLLPILFSFFALSNVCTGEKVDLKVGDTICTVGYIMDSYCIDQNSLVDNPSVKPLSQEGPLVHSVHCLVDVASCVVSPWEILNDASGGKGTSYGRSFRAQNNDELIAYAKVVGICTDGCVGTQKAGLKAAVTGTLVDLGSGGVPATIDILSVTNTTCVATNGVITAFNIPNFSTEEGSLVKVILIHGSLMLIGWGFLLPLGSVIAKFFKHRPDGLWFKIHKSVQCVGLLLVTVSFIIILNYSNALADKESSTLRYPHAVMGVTTMVLGYLQPLNAVFRPHATKEGEEKSSARAVWEILHKGLGWSTLMLAVATIGVGTTLLAEKSTQRAFQICYGALIGGLLVLVVTFLLADKKKYEEVKNDEPQNNDQTDV